MTASRSRAWASSAASCSAVQAGWWRSWRASIPIASGRYPHSLVMLAHRGVSGADPGAGGQPGQQRGRLFYGQGVQADHGGVIAARSAGAGW